MREADRRKDEFLALLSHELRNPLAPILTAARADGAARRRRHAARARGDHPPGASTSMRLVDDLLDVSRVARGKVTLAKKRLELRGRGRRRRSRRRRRCSRSGGTSFTCRSRCDGLAVDADEVRLTQVVSNLLTNAARYTPPGGRVEVIGGARRRRRRARRARQRDGHRLRPAAARVRHVRAGRARTPTARRAASGLGPVAGANADRAARRHGRRAQRRAGPGQRVHGAPAGGRRAAVRRRRRARAGGDRDRRRPGAARSRRRRQPRRRRHDRRSCCRAPGTRSRSPPTRRRRWRRRETFRPQVAILDIGLPVMDGYTLARELRARLGDATPILIALTGYGQEQDLLRSEEAGFARHLVKPIDARKLIQLVDSLAKSLSGRRAAVRLRQNTPTARGPRRRTGV